MNFRPIHIFNEHNLLSYFIIRNCNYSPFFLKRKNLIGSIQKVETNAVITGSRNSSAFKGDMSNRLFKKGTFRIKSKSKIDNEIINGISLFLRLIVTKIVLVKERLNQPKKPF